MTRQRDRRAVRGGEGFRPGRGSADPRAQQDRTRIAQVAARLIAEHGLTDWSTARRKAARELALSESGAMPSNDDIEQALLDYHALFGGEAHVESLREQRREALRWMQRLAAWHPLLVGGVAAGWASAHSDVRLEVIADDPKSVEITLAGEGVTYAALPSRDDDTAQLRIDTPRGAVRVSILTPIQRRHRPRRDEDARLDAPAVAALLEAGEGEER